MNSLETLIADHVKNARIAINAGTDTKRKIFVELGLIGGCYGLCVHDTGVEFKIDTLASLGIRPTTTHAEAGGSGIGFMTTFEMLRKYNASLVIEESDSGYFTKRIFVHFDGKNQYIIRTGYRYEKLKAELAVTQFEIML